VVDEGAAYYPGSNQAAPATNTLSFRVTPHAEESLLIWWSNTVGFLASLGMTHLSIFHAIVEP
jgi:hypothetical protein